MGGSGLVQVRFRSVQEFEELLEAICYRIVFVMGDELCPT